ncbi:PREDICTED: uncharacterized protein LOC101362440 [Odobenus rosmarus divergens]|uniref:Uncharacterized protein LOC101362440 n=1 Tax=Odobenus rosmarus divergens TaxID=9708 RepID=A0A9B0LRP5_ODORO
MPLVSLLWAVVVSTCLGSSTAQTVTQTQPDTSVRETETGTLHCTYDTSDSDYYLFWYKQPPSGEMILIIRQEAYKQENATKDRFSVNFQKAKKSFSLGISDSRLEDAAMYFCALWELLSGLDLRVRGHHPLIFGKGTYLEVEPRSQPPVKPSVFTMKNGTTVACLVKDFYPKNININLESSKKLEEFEPAIVISPSGKYSAVKLGRYGDSNSVTCSVEHNNEIVRSTDFEPKTKSSGTVKPTEPENMEQTSESLYGPKGGGNRLTFGKGTQLIIQPYVKEPDPAVYQLGGSKSNQISVCLFTDFGSETNVQQPQGPAVISLNSTVLDMKVMNSKSNAALAWGNSTDFKCNGTFNEKFFSSSDFSCNATLIEKNFETDMNLNFHNLLVIGLRILLLKVAGFNLLMTLRLWSR